jgi:alkanesulfonate monooxygenase SsuD/methylene tetrahydromethanopterin reductase-like flavin-dependent oxidoreductase (luciferase family)
MLLPLRHVLDTARIVGTVDQLAGGRLTAFGVGLGWAQGEFDALGIPFERRAAITDDCLAALRELWSSDLAAYEGAYARFSGVQTAPPPRARRRSGSAVWRIRRSDEPSGTATHGIRSRSRSSRSPSTWSASA